MEGLEIHPEYEEGVPVLDFSEVPFPNLKHLTIYYQSMKAVHFTKEMTPMLESCRHTNKQTNKQQNR